MKPTTLFVCVLTAAAWAGAGATAQAQITNGGFETGAFTGWTQFGDTHFNFVGGSWNGVAPAGGLSQGIFGPTLDWGGISQTVTANAGDTVTISFMLANDPYGSTVNQAFECDLNDVALMYIVNTGPSPYTFYSFQTVTAVDNPVLTFYFYNTLDYYLMDNVSASVPTPAAAALIGLGGLTSLRRRHRPR